MYENYKKSMFNEKILTSFEYYLRPVCCNCGNSNEIELQNTSIMLDPGGKDNYQVHSGVIPILTLRQSLPISHHWEEDHQIK